MYLEGRKRWRCDAMLRWGKVRWSEFLSFSAILAGLVGECMCAGGGQKMVQTRNENIFLSVTGNASAETQLAARYAVKVTPNPFCCKTGQAVEELYMQCRCGRHPGKDFHPLRARFHVANARALEKCRLGNPRRLPTRGKLPSWSGRGRVNELRVRHVVTSANVV